MLILPYSEGGKIDIPKQILAGKIILFKILFSIIKDVYVDMQVNYDDQNNREKPYDLPGRICQ
jgi:hypothetical protein